MVIWIESPTRSTMEVMGGKRSSIVAVIFLTGCLPRPQPAQPVAPIQDPAPIAAQPQVQPQPQAQPQPQPYPQQYPQPYYPQPYPYTPPAPMTTVETRSHFHDGEVIGDFAAVGALASID